MEISSISSSISPLTLNSINNNNNKNNDGSFANMLSDAIKEVNTSQVEGYKAMEGIATGKVKNLQEAVQKIEEADLSLKLGLEVKNKAISAFKEISTMQV